MNAQPGRNSERLAKASRNLGILSFGFLVLPILILLYARFSGRYTDFAQVLSVGFLASFLILGSLVVGILGCITAIIALIRNKKEGDHQKIKRKANIGLVLSSLGIVTVLILLTSSLLFRPSGPSPTFRLPNTPTAIP